jgi:hypothetical protein
MAEKTDFNARVGGKFDPHRLTPCWPFDPSADYRAVKKVNIQKICPHYFLLHWTAAYLHPIDLKVLLLLYEGAGWRNDPWSESDLGKLAEICGVTIDQLFDVLDNLRKTEWVWYEWEFHDLTGHHPEVTLFIALFTDYRDWSEHRDQVLERTFGTARDRLQKALEADLVKLPMLDVKPAMMPGEAISYAHLLRPARLHQDWQINPPGAVTWRFDAYQRIC